MDTRVKEVLFFSQNRGAAHSVFARMKTVHNLHEPVVCAVERSTKAESLRPGKSIDRNAGV